LPGHCTQCNAWLGSAFPRESVPEISEETRAWQEWLWRTLEELRALWSAFPALTWEQFFTHLASGFPVRGERSKFAEIVGMPQRLLGYWMRRSRTPSVERILELCYICNMTPLQVMLGDLSPIKQIIQKGKPYRELPYFSLTTITSGKLT
jgi:hypothetical protein